MLKTISILVTGKVQGVWYRKHTQQKAAELGITGTVQNQKDGTVYIIATGTDEQLQQLVYWCKQGPPGAAVEEVTFAELSLQHFDGFHIVRHLF